MDDIILIITINNILYYYLLIYKNIFKYLFSMNQFN